MHRFCHNSGGRLGKREMGEANYGRMSYRFATLGVLRFRRPDFKRHLATKAEKASVNEAWAGGLAPIVNLRCRGHVTPERPIALRRAHAQIV